MTPLAFSRGMATCVVALLAATPAAAAEPAEVIDLKSIEPHCESPYKLAKDPGTCEPDGKTFATFKTAEACTTPGGHWQNDACSAPTDKAKFPLPTCGSALPDLVYNAAKKACQIQRSVPRASLGDFVGDCFWIQAPPPDGMDNGLRAREYWIVESQRAIGNDDKELVVAPARSWPVSWLTLGCSATHEKEQRKRASTLIASGAHRFGWTYGVLTLPFKYHSHDKSFTPGSLNIGPFLGRRWGSSGSAITLAAAATLGSVKGEVRDSQGTVTSTPDLTAFSWAFGLMLDVSKNPELKPFKLGLFYGADRVNANDVVKYKHNRKPWVAFQIGYDFTDTK